MNSKIKTSFRRTNKKAARRSTETSFKRIKTGGERQGENLWDAMLRTQGNAGSSKNYNEIHRRIFGKSLALAGGVICMYVCMYV